MPQGSSVAPPWFTMVVNEVVKGLDHVLAYPDDVIVFNADPIQHDANIPLVLSVCARIVSSFLLSSVASTLRKLPI